MQRRIRTRRLSFAATMSFAALLALSLAGIRSFWTSDALYLPAGCRLLISHGYFQYSHTWISQASGYPLKERSLSYESGLDPMEPGSLGRRFLGFSFFHIKASQTSNCLDLFELWIPIWFPLLILLIAPVRWLIARSGNAPAFPIIAETCRSASASRT